MADRRSSGNRRQSSRLQTRAPASIQVNRAADWNVAIPLLSPLVQSPTSPDSRVLTAEVKPETSSEKQSGNAAATAAAFKKWQHPAAPFYYEPAPMMPFVSTAQARFAVDRRLK